MLNKIIFGGWIFFALCLLTYSFTQVDLSLTLSQASFWQDIQKVFQHVGYFNRPLSAAFFIALGIFSLVLYLLTISQVHLKKISGKTLSKIVIALSVILFFSYNAFSYDLFNYIFDAKIITFYQENPYDHKALDYPGDPMLSFMHWTHRTYPYGPAWLALTVPLSFVGFGYFLLTFYLFKLLMVASFIGSCFLIRKIAKDSDVDPDFAMAVFAFNPLVLVESLVSAHNDIVMMFFALLGLYAFLKRKMIKSFIWFLVSILIKFATAFALPALVFDIFFKVSRNTLFMALTVSMIAAVFVAIFRTNFQPWYLLMILPFASLVSNRTYVLVPTVIISFFALFQYLPYLYLGNWDAPIPQYLNIAMVSSVILSVVIVLILKVVRR